MPPQPYPPSRSALRWVRTESMRVSIKVLPCAQGRARPPCLPRRPRASKSLVQLERAMSGEKVTHMLSYDLGHRGWPLWNQWPLPVADRTALTSGYCARRVAAEFRLSLPSVRYTTIKARHPTGHRYITEAVRKRIRWGLYKLDGRLARHHKGGGTPRTAQYQRVHLS